MPSEIENDNQVNSQDVNNKKEETDSDQSGNAIKSTENTGGGTGNFMIGILVPLFAFYFMCYKLYTGSYEESSIGNNTISSKIAILKVLLLVVLFSTMYALNTTQMKKMCPNGTKNLVTKVFFSTFIPFIFLFGTVVVALSLMPGWKAPFSNTLGYSIVKNVAYRKLFSLQDWTTDGKDEPDSEIAKFNQKSNRTFFVNELTPENFFDAIKSLNITFGNEDDYPVQKMLYKAIIVKDFISEFIWYFFTALLTFSLSQIYILDSTCEPEVDEIIKRQQMNNLNNEEGDDDDEGSF